ncbi:MAG: hypothetical protein ACXWWX_05310, partial [Actinomycetota bacterium]
ARRERGHPLPYTFDGLPFDFVDRLVATCDREALEACQLTGDLGLLMVYIRDRNNLLEVAGNRVFDPSAPSADDGSDLIERCGRYHVDFDATFADDRVAWELPGQRGHPLSHERNRWRLQLSVDLRWERVVGAVPWVGRMVGEAVPEWTGLGAQRRSFVAHQNDQGEVTGGWAPWCVWGFGIGPWKPWPVELKGLDFARERVQEELPKPPPAIQILLGIHDAQDEAERSGPTFNFEAPLRTTSFKSATLVFHELAGPTVHHSGCVSGGSGFLSGTYPNADMILGLFVRTQPRETKWRNTEVGLSASPVDLKERGSHPEIARVAWTSGRPPDPNLYPSVVERYDWRGTVVLTHTPLGGG